MASEVLTVNVNDAFFIFDIDSDEAKTTQQAVCALDRRTGRIGERCLLIPSPECYRIHCLIGAIKMLAGPYMVIATDCKRVGTLLRADIFQITYISLVTNLLTDGSFLFSHSIDLTRSSQRKTEQPDVYDDPAFSWSRAMRDRFVELTKLSPQSPLNRFFAPIIRGFVEISQPVDCAGTNVIYALIARLNPDRPGRRYTKRGASKEGAVTNHVESEQIIMKENAEVLTSFVQVRGSIPLLWNQHTNLAWNPPIRLKDGSTVQNNVLKAHFKSQLDVYKRETIVNLIKTSGSEHILGQAYDKYTNLGKPKGLQYISFDLHKEVGTSKMQNLKKLFDVSDASVNSYGFFKVTPDSTVSQSGVMRTNCKDNLDRTNLVQTRFAMQVGLKQIATVIGTDPHALPQSVIEWTERLIRLTWADHGDRLSVMYAGTPAIRADHTRTGKTSMRGLVNDAVNSMTRFYINNFEDGEHQDALDVLLEKRPLSSSYTLDLKVRPMRKLDKFRETLTSLFILLFTLVRPTRNPASTLSTCLCIAWSGLVWLVWTFFKLDPARIVSTPILKYNQVKAGKAIAAAGGFGVEGEVETEKEGIVEAGVDIDDIEAELDAEMDAEREK